MAPKGYKLYKTNDFIRKSEQGELDFPRSIRLVGEIVEAASHHRDVDLLIDIRETETKLNFVDLLPGALEFAKHEDVFGNRIAFLIPNDRERIDRARFVKESLVGVRGFTLDYFTDFEGAIDWLSSIEDHPERPPGEE